MNEEKIVEDFCKHICIVCKHRIAVFCGTPIIHIGGCCSGVESNKTKTIYLREVKCHYWCYQKQKGKVKTKFQIEEVNKVLDDERRLRASSHS